jgi:hypothetical protein
MKLYSKSNFYDKFVLIKRRALPLFFSFLVVIAGCDIFSTRSAEMPTQPRSDFTPAATEDILIQNLINSLKDKDVNTYLICLSDTLTGKEFQFLPSSEAAAQYPSLTDNWNRKSEEDYFKNLSIKTKDNSQITLSLTESSRNNFGDSTFYTATYTLSVPFVNSSSDIITKIYEGTLTFKMVRDDRTAVWSIYYWQDNKNSTSNSNPSWSDLKGSSYENL